MSEQNLRKNPFAALDEQADLELPEGSVEVYEYIQEHFSRSDDTNVLRGSAATMCVKRRWYQHNGYPSKSLTPRKILNFSTGDISERMMVYFVEKACVGPGKLFQAVNFGEVLGTVRIQHKDIPMHAQLHTQFDLGDGRQVACNLDGLAQAHDGSWELQEFKSAADFGFKSFKEEGPEDYLKQAHAYMLSDLCRSLNVRRVRFWYFRKQTGHIYDRVFHFDETLAHLVRQEYFDSTAEIEPATPFELKAETTGKKPNQKVTGRYLAEFPCTYCPYIEACHGPCSLEWRPDWLIPGISKPVMVFERANKKAGAQ